MLLYPDDRAASDEVESVAAAPRRNLSILVTSFNYRSYANWEPVFHRLRCQGHTVRTAFFPRISDPDHAKLLDIELDNVVLSPIGPDFQTCGRSEKNVLSDLAGWIEAAKPDLVWMCTCHGGPEGSIHRQLSRLPDRPLTIGLQHGMAHDWPLFESWTDRFDVFGTFGRYFLNRCSVGFQHRMVVLGLPKLDDFRGPWRTGPIRRILFAGQSEPPIDALEGLLCELASDASAEIVVRPHPEHRGACCELYESFAVNWPDDPLVDVLGTFDALITTGSTIALEGLAAGLRVAVLPCEHGNVYRSAGIVARSLSPADILAVLNRYDDATFRAGIARFLEGTTGSADGGRTDIAVAAIGDLVRQRAMR
jgi:hypothetical protein